MSKCYWYQCTGLDYGCVVVGRVVVEATGEVLEEYRFGPIGMEEPVRAGLQGTGSIGVRLQVGRS